MKKVSDILKPIVNCQLLIVSLSAFLFFLFSLTFSPSPVNAQPTCSPGKVCSSNQLCDIDTSTCGPVNCVTCISPYNCTTLSNIANCRMPCGGSLFCTYPTTCGFDGFGNPACVSGAITCGGGQRCQDATANYTGNIGEIVCGADFQQWQCTSSGLWTPLGGYPCSCPASSIRCPNGQRCGDATNNYSGYVGEVVCAPDSQLWQCHPNGGWAPQGANTCTCNIVPGYAQATYGPGYAQASYGPGYAQASYGPGPGGGGGLTGLGVISAPVGFNLPFISGDANVFVAGLVRNGIGAMILIAFVVALIWLILAGFKFILANGEPKEVSAAWSQIRYALIGLAVIMSAFAIIKLVEIFFNVDILGGGLRLPTRTS